MWDCFWVTRTSTPWRWYLPESHSHARTVSPCWKLHDCSWENNEKQWCWRHPFLHAFSGKDDTNFIYDIGKTKVLKIRHQLNCKSLAPYGDDNNYEVTNQLITEARKVLMNLYGGQIFASLAALHARLFISGEKSKDLRGLPLTDNAFKQHLLRSLLAALVQKKAQVAIPMLSLTPAFAWKMGITHLEPISIPRTHTISYKLEMCCKQMHSELFLH